MREGVPVVAGRTVQGGDRPVRCAVEDKKCVECVRVKLCSDLSSILRLVLWVEFGNRGVRCVYAECGPRLRPLSFITQPQRSMWVDL